MAHALAGMLVLVSLAGRPSTGHASRVEFKALTTPGCQVAKHRSESVPQLIWLGISTLAGLALQKTLDRTIDEVLDLASAGLADLLNADDYVARAEERGDLYQVNSTNEVTDGTVPPFRNRCLVFIRGSFGKVDRLKLLADPLKVWSAPQLRRHGIQLGLADLPELYAEFEIVPAQDESKAHLLTIVPRVVYARKWADTGLLAADERRLIFGLRLFDPSNAQYAGCDILTFEGIKPGAFSSLGGSGTALTLPLPRPTKEEVGWLSDGQSATLFKSFHQVRWSFFLAEQAGPPTLSPDGRSALDGFCG